MRLGRWVAIGALLIAPRISAAEEDPSPGRVDEQARQAFEAQKYREAAELFERAFRIAPHPATQFNIALAWDRAGEPARAADGYEAALAMQGLGADMAEAARKRLAILKRSLGYIEVLEPVGGTLSVMHAENAPIPTSVHLPPGTHRVKLKHRDGSTREREIKVLAGQVVSMMVEKEAIQVREKQNPAPPRVEQPEAEPKSSPAGGKTWGYVALGGAVAAGATAVFFGVKMDNELDTFEKSNRTDADTRDRASRYKLYANIATGVAVVAGAVGVVILLSDSGPKREARSELRLGLGLGSVDATLRF